MYPPRCQQVQIFYQGFTLLLCRSLVLVETVRKTNLAGPMLKHLAAMNSSIAAVEGMQTIFTLKMSACKAADIT